MYRTQLIDPTTKRDQEETKQHALIGQTLNEIDEIVELIGQEPKTSYNSNKLESLKQEQMFVIEFHNTDAHITVTKV